MPRPKKSKPDSFTPDAFTPDGEPDFSQYENIQTPKEPKTKRTTEIHHPKFTGCWIHRDVMEMFWRGDINPREVMLLATIDSLVGKLGCFASNEYLGNLFRCGPKHIAYMIATLREKGFVRTVRFDGKKRYLETKWHRVDKHFRGDD